MDVSLDLNAVRRQLGHAEHFIETEGGERGYFAEGVKAALEWATGATEDIEWPYPPPEPNAPEVDADDLPFE